MYNLTFFRKKRTGTNRKNEPERIDASLSGNGSVWFFQHNHHRCHPREAVGGLHFQDRDATLPRTADHKRGPYGIDDLGQRLKPEGCTIQPKTRIAWRSFSL
jgi:hypothetical protein